PSEKCDTASVQAMAPADTTVQFAYREFGGGCRVHGYVTTQNPGPNKVVFVLMLPDQPNWRYLYIGVGGAAGVLPTVPSELYRRGYIIAGSDGGTGAKTGADFSFKSDPGKAADFAGRGVHVSAQATQAIAAAYYKRAPAGRYITGCSGGGQMGLTNAMRFGKEDFDGFIVGATPLPGSTFHPNIYRVMHYIQNHPEGWISPELAKKADAAIMARYDESDGAKDGVIADTRNIRDFDVSILRDVGFTPAQIALFNAISQPAPIAFPGMEGRMQPGFPFADLTGWTRYPLGRSAPPWPSAAKVPPGELARMGASFFHTMVDTKVRNHEPNTYYADIKDPAHLARLGMAEMEFQGSLDTAAKSGAKVIVFHGVNDEAMSYLETMASYADLTTKYPNSRDWLRVFPVAGLMHCRGGVGPTDAPEKLLDAVADWVEKGTPADTVVTYRSAMPFNWIEQGRLETVVPADKARDWEREFRLCAEPSRVVLKAPGLDPKKADNWVCRAPAGKS
ncbi:MAG: tannase/feruloyl esterase family alpha/beta hydrolase, partial [Novosphingobium sp.]